MPPVFDYEYDPDARAWAVFRAGAEESPDYFDCADDARCECELRNAPGEEPSAFVRGAFAQMRRAFL